VIKMVLAMREGVLPRTLHVREPSTRVEWSAGRIELLREPVTWPVGERRRRAGVSSFGMSGTNAHLILEEPPSRDRKPEDDDGHPLRSLSGAVPLVLSARTPAALRESAARLRMRMEDSGLDASDVGHSLVTTRASFERRTVVLGDAAAELRGGLSALARGTDDRRLVIGLARPLERCAFVYPGFGSLWLGMTLALREASPLFAARLDECVEAIEPHFEWSLAEFLRCEDAADVTAPAEAGPMSLFATMVALTELWRSFGVEPSALVGHSQGEVVAACVAGGLSLEDAALVAVVRTRALREIAGGGAMAAVPLGIEALEPLLEPWGERIDVAALNGPAATVLSGEVEAIDGFVERCAAEEVDAKKISGAIVASHSRQVDRLRKRMLSELAGIRPRSGGVPFHSTVTGAVLDTAELGPEYWYENMRRTVRFEPVVRGLIGDGCGAFVEVSPHPVLALAVRATAGAATGEPDSVTAIGSLRRNDGGGDRFARSLAEAHVAGLDVDWSGCFDSGAKVVRLPTYPFQRRRYWPDGASESSAGDVASAGLESAGHPLLGAAVEGPEGEWTFTGRLSAATHPWLAERRVLAAASLPPSAFVELGLAVAAELGGGGVAELGVREPLELVGEESVQLRVMVRPAGDDGERRLQMYSRPEPAGDDGARSWTLHAEGRLIATTEPPASSNVGTWPPAEAETVDVEALYDELERAGLHHAPGFRALRRLWREGSSLVAELELPDDRAASAAGYGIHPALLDCAAQIAIARGEELWEGGAEAPSQPLEWTGVRLHAAGRAALRLRVERASGGIRLSAFDPEGDPVLEVESALPVPIPPAQLEAARLRRWLHRLDWLRVPERQAAALPPVVAILGDAGTTGIEARRYPDLAALVDACAGGDVPDVVLVDLDRRAGRGGDVAVAARATCRRALELLQAWAGAEALQAARLVVLTEGAVAAVEGEDVDLVTAPLWGMLRAAHQEHPGRFAAIDLDGDEASREALPAALALTVEEPQLALRAGRPLMPRLTPVSPASGEHQKGPIDPETTVLISDGIGAIGAVVARHLVERHGARHLLLLNHPGLEASSAGEIERDLHELGAEVSVLACDVADRDRLREALDAIPAEHPLGAVVHAAAAFDNGVLASLDGERLEAVMRPKIDGAWNLHELTRDTELSQFVLFASGVGVLGAVAKASYAAANVFLDALAAHRHAVGLVSTSLDWGGCLLEADLLAGLGDAGLGQADLARLKRLGVAPMSAELGLEMFDLARESGAPQLVPVGFDVAALRVQAASGTLAPALRGLVAEPAAGPVAGVSLRERLAGVPEGQRRSVVTDLVRECIAAVLGYSSAEEVSPDRLLQEMGFDSLGAVELRNELATTTGLPIPILALSEDPTPDGIATYLLGQLQDADSGTPAANEDRGATGTDGTGLVDLLGRALDEAERGDAAALDACMEALSLAADRRPGFDDPGHLHQLPRGAWLADGPDSTTVVLLPSVGATAGPYEYVKLARSLAERFSAISVPLPGFAEGEPLPMSVDALVRAYAQAIEAEGVERPCVLVGHSSGGWVAQALASHLDEAGAPPAAAILLDTYLPRSTELRPLLPLVLRGAHEAGRGSPAMLEARLTAMARYGTLFADWRPATGSFPTVVVEAGERGEPARGGPAREWEDAGPCDRTLTVPGDHFALMDEHADTTARAIAEALAELAVTTDK
jgi:malonyl CoA-acyl carrier protein transacylase/thioesterase domain-containing protein/acyl carrier protein